MLTPPPRLHSLLHPFLTSQHSFRPIAPSGAASAAGARRLSGCAQVVQLSADPVTAHAGAGLLDVGQRERPALRLHRPQHLVRFRAPLRRRRLGALVQFEPGPPQQAEEVRQPGRQVMASIVPALRRRVEGVIVVLPRRRSRVGIACATVHCARFNQYVGSIARRRRSSRTCVARLPRVQLPC